MNRTQDIENLLLVEDAKDVQLLVKATLMGAKSIDVAETLESARNLLKNRKYDAIILDVSLPDGSGFDLCQELREIHSLKNVPVIFLTSKNETQDRVLGFTLGGDDYIVKPFEPEELLVRLVSKLRRQPEMLESTNISFDGLRVDLSKQKAFIQDSRGETDLNLTPIELRILSILVQNNGDVASRADLVTAIWEGVHVSGHAIDTHISSLRKKLSPGYAVKSVFKKGYQLLSTPALAQLSS